MKNILKHIKHLLFPVKGNNYRPNILKEEFLISVFFILFFLLGLSFGRYFFFHKTILGESVESSILIDLTNEVRVENKIPPLLRNDLLDSASLLKADDMIENQYFAHVSPKGISPWYWFKKIDYDFRYAGENLGLGFLDSKDLQNAWLNSPTHRANILNNKYKDIGITVKEGKFEGRNDIFVVQMFGTLKDDFIDNNIQNKTEKNKSDINNGNIQIEKPNQNSQVLGEATSTDIYKDTVKDNIKYSTKKDRIIFDFWYKLNLIYKSILIIISISLFSYLFIEIERHHWRHILYGLISIFVILVLIYINYHLW